MKATNTRRPLHKQAEPEQKGPFFAKANDDIKKKDDVFFQTKLTVNEPGDQHEQEADQVADSVQRKTEEKKEEPGVQKKDKEEDKKEAVQKKESKEEEKPVQKKGDNDKKEDDKAKVSKKEEEKKEAVQKKEAKEEEKPVQKMGSDKKEEDKTNVKKKERSGTHTDIMKKEAGGVHPAAHPVSLEERIKQNKGKGQSLPDGVRAFLEAQLGADFAEVVIHTDNEAIAMNQELNSLAFTTGYDIYFNAGQYQPDTVSGQKLLAHELTHVVQQTGVSKKDGDKKKEDKK